MGRLRLPRVDSLRLSGEAMLLGAVVLWALNFTVVKYAITHGFSPLGYAAPRFAIAGLMLGGLTVRREGSLRVYRRDFFLLGCAALIGISLNQVTFVYALHLTGAATVALVFGTAPVLVSLVAHFSGNERLGTRSWVGAALSFAGVALVVTAGGGVSGSVGGLLLAFVCAASWAVYAVMVAPLMRRYSPSRLTGIVTLLGSAPLLVVAAPQLVHEHWGRIGPVAWLAFLFSLGVYVVGNVIWFTAILRVGPSRSALYVNLEPFLGAVFAVLILSERLGALQVAGGIVIAIGIFVARRRRDRIPLTE